MTIRSYFRLLIKYILGYDILYMRKSDLDMCIRKNISHYEKLKTLKHIPIPFGYIYFLKEGGEK